MRWKYHIPHLWITPRTRWEDIWLMPDDSNHTKSSIWLTIDALGDSSDPTRSSDEIEFQKIALEKLGDRHYWIESGDMIVRVKDFDKEEFLGWVQVWLQETGFKVTELIECSFAEFRNTNDHANIADLLSKSSQ